MGLRSYLHHLPSQPIPVRQRFVIVATCSSFLLVVLLWVGTTFVGRQLSPGRSPAPVLAGAGSRPGAAVGARGSPRPLDFNEISASLLRALGPRTRAP